MTEMKKEGLGKDAPEQEEAVDTSRRKMLGNAGKAAWVTPTLVFLSFTASADEPPPPPSCTFPPCEQGEVTAVESGRVKTKQESRRKKRGD